MEARSSEAEGSKGQATSGKQQGAGSRGQAAGEAASRGSSPAARAPPAVELIVVDPPQHRHSSLPIAPCSCIRRRRAPCVSRGAGRPGLARPLPPPLLGRLCSSRSRKHACRQAGKRQPVQGQLESMHVGACVPRKAPGSLRNTPGGQLTFTAACSPCGVLAPLALASTLVCLTARPAASQISRQREALCSRAPAKQEQTRGGSAKHSAACRAALPPQQWRQWTAPNVTHLMPCTPPLQPVNNQASVCPTAHLADSPAAPPCLPAPAATQFPPHCPAWELLSSCGHWGAPAATQAAAISNAGQQV